MEKSALTNLGIKLAKFILGFWKTHLCFCFYKYISIPKTNRLREIITSGFCLSLFSLV